MSQDQYLKTLKKDIREINKIIDEKIMRGESYKREARDHKLMMRHLRYHTGQSIWRKPLFRKFSF